MPFPPQPHRSRLYARLAILAAAVTVIVGAFATPTAAAGQDTATPWPTPTLKAPKTPVYPARYAATTGPVYEGTGWKANTDNGIYSLNPDPYEIVFADTTARTKLKSYFLRPAAQADAVTGVTITVTDTIDLTPRGICPPRHRIVVHYTYRPMGTAGYSKAEPCYQLSDGSAWGGHVLMDSEYWTTANWFSVDPTLNDVYRKNVVVHELGHILGLEHPNKDLDGDATVENFECVKNAAGWLPTMCSPNGGYRNATSAGQFVAEFDVVGLKQLTQNWYLRQG